MKKWKVWRLFGIGFGCILAYALLMYVTIDVQVGYEQYRLAIFLRGAAYAILAPTLMWSLNESIHDLEQFFMGLFIFNILHMYLGGAVGYGFYTTLFNHLLSDNMSSYGHYITATRIDLAHFNFGEFMDGYFLRSMMSVTLKQAYGFVIWLAGTLTLLFLALDIPAVRTNVMKVPRWPVFAIEYLAKKL